jgi:hypothetical protein
MNPNDREHCQLAKLVETSTNIGCRDVKDRSVDSVLHALYDTGFEVVGYEDLAASERSNVVPWHVQLSLAIGDPNIEWSPTSITTSPSSGYLVNLTKNAATILYQAGKSKVCIRFYPILQ